jgi:hypothetical protein
MPSVVHLMGGDERIETRTRSDIDDTFALRKLSKRKRIRQARKGLHGRVRQRLNKFVIVAKTSREMRPVWK